MSPRPLWNRLDLLLLALAAVGLALFLTVLPHHHPDAAATFELGAEGAAAESRSFLEANGYDLDGLTATARLTREVALIDSLQTTLGRTAAVQALREGAREQLPTHYWDVRWSRQEGSASTRVFTVRVSPGGRVWAFTNRENRQPAVAEAEEVPVPYRLTPEEDWGEGNAGPMQAPIFLSLRRSAEVAAAHLERTAWSEVPLAADSTWTVARDGRPGARVRFTTPEPVLGQRVSVEADVAPNGALLALGATFNDHADRPGAISLSQEERRTALRWGGYALLVLLLLMVVLRRLAVRALDVRAAQKDAALAAVAGGATVILSLPLFSGEALVQQIVFLGLGTVFAALSIGLLAFVASAGADALVRAQEPTPVHTLGLVRQGAWLNEPVGRALWRGAALGLGIVGAGTLAFWLFPNAVLHTPVGSAPMTSESTLSVVGSGLAGAVWLALVYVQVALVGFGAFVQRWRASLVLPATALAAAVLYGGFVRVPDEPFLVAAACVLVIGAGLALAYRATDALTVIVALVAARTLWATAEGVVVTGSPAWADTVLALGLIGGVAAFGVAGVYSRRAGEELPRYEPEFVLEQRERGRLQRELEIARQVQQSFLPSRIPAVEGVELAARCVPADEVGGDYYDLIKIGPDRLAVVIGDVSGKGIEAAFFMTLVKGFLQTLARQELGPAEVLRRVNALFYANAPRGAFVSLLYGVLDLRACTLTFARAGHTPLIVRRAGQPVAALRPPGLAIGLTEGPAFDATLREETVELCPLDALVLYTDGLSEAMDASRVLYGDDRLAKTVETGPDGAGELLDHIVADVRAHAGPAGPADDVTVVILRVAPALSSEPALPDA